MDKKYKKFQWAVVTENNTLIIETTANILMEDIKILFFDLPCQIIPRTAWGDRIILGFLTKDFETHDLELLKKLDGEDLKKLFSNLEDPVKVNSNSFSISRVLKEDLDYPEKKKLFKNIEEALEKEKTFEQQNIEENRRRALEARIKSVETECEEINDWNST